MPIDLNETRYIVMYPPIDVNWGKPRFLRKCGKGEDVDFALDVDIATRFSSYSIAAQAAIETPLAKSAAHLPARVCLVKIRPLTELVQIF